MISPQLYREHVLPRDTRFFETFGGGRMHYCGITDAIIDDFFKVPSITGLDIDCTKHDFFDICQRAPSKVVITSIDPFNSDAPEVQRLLNGDWPEKRNIIVSVSTRSIKEGKILLERLRGAIPY